MLPAIISPKEERGGDVTKTRFSCGKLRKQELLVSLRAFFTVLVPHCSIRNQRWLYRQRHETNGPSPLSGRYFSIMWVTVGEGV